MLVLSRKAKEEIIIGDKIVLTVIKVAAGKIKVGITAPEDFKVHRLDKKLVTQQESGEDSHEI
ncbi:carbon storage regulator, CsrA [Selenomonas ruminantium]|uniref:Translational regulator CsrA n=1 Tax=Selenomonas ruminantium TaxID=971 RepID=A0A1I3G7G6_SELRU|nr:carbon storage regulator [Selenomonas ruminantium]SFI19465.1 carbon storage regulator, CsrA [Selenomonas ruminantium]